MSNKISSLAAMLHQSQPLARSFLRSQASSRRAFSQTSQTLQTEGQKPKDHVTDKPHELDVQSAASKSGKRDRLADTDGPSQATSERDQGSNNERAKKDHPEAPGPVLGMNDERGGVSDPCGLARNRQ